MGAAHFHTDFNIFIFVVMMMMTTTTMVLAGDNFGGEGQVKPSDSLMNKLLSVKHHSRSTLTGSAGKLRSDRHGRGKFGEVPVAVDQNNYSSKGSKIVGGQGMPHYSKPYLVLVTIKRNGAMYIICGGTLINSSTVVTAAHCFTKYPAAQYGIMAGEYDYTVYEGKEQIIDASVTIHPDYHKDWYLNDVAVMKLWTPVQLTSEVGTIDLNNDRECPVTSSMCSVAGWGNTMFDGQGSSVPLMTELSIQAQTRCSNVYGQYGDSQICAGGNGVEDTCQGDSGGPLVCFCGSGQKLVGIVSYGHECAVKDFPGVYTRVSSFRDWIVKNS